MAFVAQFLISHIEPEAKRDLAIGCMRFTHARPMRKTAGAHHRPRGASRDGGMTKTDASGQEILCLAGKCAADIIRAESVGSRRRVGGDEERPEPTDSTRRHGANEDARRTGRRRPCRRVEQDGSEHDNPEVLVIWIPLPARSATPTAGQLTGRSLMAAGLAPPCVSVRLRSFVSNSVISVHFVRRSYSRCRAS